MHKSVENCSPSQCVPSIRTNTPDNTHDFTSSTSPEPKAQIVFQIFTRIETVQQLFERLYLFHEFTVSYTKKF